MIRAIGLNREGNPVAVLGVANVTRLWSKRGGMIWVDMENCPMEEVEFLAVTVGVHPLTIEDCLTFNAIPKIDAYSNYLYLVLHGLKVKKERDEDGRFDVEEVDVFLGKDFLITYHDRPNQALSYIWERIGQMNEYYDRGPDRLLHMLMDKIIDDIIPEVENLEELVEDLEHTVVSHSSEKDLPEIFGFKRDASTLHRLILPQRDVVGRLSRGEFEQIANQSLPFFRDVYDNVNRLLSITENLRSTLSSVMEAYLSAISNRMNQVMKVLTIITTIMMPLTVLTGMYGMNFSFIPFMDHPFGFWGLLLIMLAISLSMIYYFKRKGWF